MNIYEANRRMIEDQLCARGVRCQRVLEAFREIPRSRFVPAPLEARAFDDSPLPIGEGQTISQPYMVALMTELLELQGNETVLEVGTGSGYQTAILSRLAHRVVSVERIGSLSKTARETLDGFGVTNVEFIVSDGSIGYEPLAPYDRILVAAASPSIPEELREQLTVGGILEIPVGTREVQTLHRIRRLEKSYQIERHVACVFVPLIGAGGYP